MNPQNITSERLPDGGLLLRYDEPNGDCFKIRYYDFSPSAALSLFKQSYKEEEATRFYNQDEHIPTTR